MCSTLITGQNAYPPGLYVEDGMIKKEGRDFYGIGVNYYDLFNRNLSAMAGEGPVDTTYLEGLRKLSEAGIPYVRFSTGMYWPVEWKNTYVQNRHLYFEQLDKVIEAAEQYNIGLIPSLVWYPMTIPDLNGEHMDQYGNDDSKTIAFIRTYTRELVQRYKDSPAIWGWEFGNEMNLYADKRDEQDPFHVDPELGTPDSRDPVRDYMKGEYMVNAYKEFAKEVRLYDQTRPILSGNQHPRPYAWHNAYATQRIMDSEAQYKEMVQRDNPDPMNTITIRGYYGGVYPEKPLGIDDYDELVEKLMEWSAEFGKPLFIGEFGENENAENTKQIFEERINTIVSHRVQLSAAWVYDLSWMTEWNITFENSRSYMLDRIIEANQVMEAFGSPEQ
ncbi:MAG: cellulase family glycosylhydrolase [Bacteroidota bacterium]